MGVGGWDVGGGGGVAGVRWVWVLCEWGGGVVCHVCVCACVCACVCGLCAVIGIGWVVGARTINLPSYTITFNKHWHRCNLGAWVHHCTHVHNTKRLKAFGVSGGSQGLARA